MSSRLCAARTLVRAADAILLRKLANFPSTSEVCASGTAVLALRRAIFKQKIAISRLKTAIFALLTAISWQLIVIFASLIAISKRLIAIFKPLTAISCQLIAVLKRLSVVSEAKIALRPSGNGLDFCSVPAAERVYLRC